jgi:hypothetical protein
LADFQVLACCTAAEALDGVTIDLGDGTLAIIVDELDTLAGRLDLLLDRLGAAVNPVPAGR